MKNTSAIGNATVGQVLAALLRSKLAVLLPFGDGGGYDLVIDKGSSFLRVECKTGVLKNGAVVFRNYTVLRDGK